MLYFHSNHYYAAPHAYHTRGLRLNPVCYKLGGIAVRIDAHTRTCTAAFTNSAPSDIRNSYLWGSFLPLIFSIHKDTQYPVARYLFKSLRNDRLKIASSHRRAFALAEAKSRARSTTTVGKTFSRLLPGSLEKGLR